MVFKTTVCFVGFSGLSFFSSNSDVLSPFEDFFLNFLDFLRLLFFGLPFEAYLSFFLPSRSPFLRLLGDFPFAGFGVEILKCIPLVSSLLFGVADAGVVGTEETFNPDKLVLSSEVLKKIFGRLSDLEQFKQELDSKSDVSSGLLLVLKSTVGKGAISLA